MPAFQTAIRSQPRLTPIRTTGEGVDGLLKIGNQSKPQHRVVGVQLAETGRCPRDQVPVPVENQPSYRNGTRTHPILPRTKRYQLIAVVATQAIARAKPNHSDPVFRNGAHSAVRDPLMDTEVGKYPGLGSPREPAP